METWVGALGGLFTVVATILAGVLTLQRIGLMASRERNPHMMKTLDTVCRTMEAMEKRMALVESEIGLSGADIKVLRVQHGEPAPQGEYESWKITPPMIKQLEQAARYAVGNAQMLEALCKAAAATSDTESRSSANWAVTEALKDFDALKRNIG